tara:strand:- start:48 stop:368 length:321 start_codon:yes stop_codon:yes gene_type:complete
MKGGFETPGASDPVIMESNMPSPGMTDPNMPYPTGPDMPNMPEPNMPYPTGPDMPSPGMTDPNIPGLNMPDPNMPDLDMPEQVISGPGMTQPEMLDNPPMLNNSPA